VSVAAPHTTTFRLERYRSDGDEESGRYCQMVIVDYEGATLHPRSIHIADIFFNGAEWLLLKYPRFEEPDRDGHIKPDHDYTAEVAWLNVDPERHARLRGLTNSHAQLHPDVEEPIRAASEAQLKFERKRYRDDTLEDALLLGTALARVYWRAVSADM
jgi:hypothetical protein